MKRRQLLLLGLAVGMLIVGGLWWWQAASNVRVVINGTAVPPVPPLDTARVTQGQTLYAQHCAQCHGANLEGAPDWKKSLADGSLPPPPHDDSGHTWHHPDSLLISIVTHGGDPASNSKMPAFKDKLTEAEIIAVLEFLKSKWSRDKREYQWWMTATQDAND